MGHALFLQLLQCLQKLALMMCFWMLEWSRRYSFPLRKSFVIVMRRQLASVGLHICTSAFPRTEGDPQFHCFNLISNVVGNPILTRSMAQTEQWKERNLTTIEVQTHISLYGHVMSVSVRILFWRDPFKCCHPGETLLFKVFIFSAYFMNQQSLFEFVNPGVIVLLACHWEFDSKRLINQYLGSKHKLGFCRICDPRGSILYELFFNPACLHSKMEKLIV